MDSAKDGLASRSQLFQEANDVEGRLRIESTDLKLAICNGIDGKAPKPT